MNDLIQLTDAEIAGVSGGIFNQSTFILASQHNSAHVTQVSIAYNSGPVIAAAAFGSVAAAAGAESSNSSVLGQSNSIVAVNSQHL